MDRHGSALPAVRPKNHILARLVYRYALLKPVESPQKLYTDLKTISCVLIRDLPPQPLPRLHIAQIRPLARTR